jgi:hypothetical protein
METVIQKFSIAEQEIEAFQLTGESVLKLIISQEAPPFGLVISGHYEWGAHWIHNYRAFHFGKKRLELRDGDWIVKYPSGIFSKFSHVEFEEYIKIQNLN